MATLITALDAVCVQGTKPFYGATARDVAGPILEDTFSLLTTLEAAWLNEADGGADIDHLSTLKADHHAAALRCVGRLVALAAAVVREG